MNRAPQITISQVPLLIPVAGLTAGVIMARMMPDYAISGAVVMTALFLLCLRNLRGLAGGCLMCAVGILTYSVHYPPQIPIGPRQTEITGTVTELRRGVQTQRMIVDGRRSDDRKRVKVMVYLHGMLPIVERGDEVAVSGTPEKIKPPVAPGELRPGEFARQQGVKEQIHTGEKQIKIIKEAGGLTHRIDRQRYDFQESVRDCGLNPECAEFMTAILTGDTSGISNEERERFADAGIAHVLALSGTHVGVIAWLTGMLFFPLALWGKRKWGVAATLIVLAGYAMLTGFPASVVRSVIMAGMVGIAYMTGRRNVALNALLASYLIIVAVDPRAIFMAGFQMSFAAVASIVLFMPFTEPGHKVGKIARALIRAGGVCVAAVAGTAPLSAWYFHSFPVYFLLANLIVGPIVPVAMTGGIMAALLHWAGIDNGMVCQLTDQLYQLIEQICGFIGQLPGAKIGGIYFPWWIMVGYYAGMLMIWMWLSRRKGIYGVYAGTLVGFCIIAQLLTGSYDRKQTEILKPDYHYATVVMVRDGNRLYLLTDGKESARKRIAEQFPERFKGYMDKYGIEKIEITDEIKDNRRVYADRNQWILGDEVIVLAREEGITATPAGEVDVVLLTGDFRGDALEAWKQSHAKRVEISPALSKKRRKAAEERLRQAGGTGD